MSTFRRMLAFGIAAALLGACGSTATTTSSGSSGSAPASLTPSPPKSTSDSSAAPPPSGSTRGTTADPRRAEIKVVTTPYGRAIGRGDGNVLYAWDKESDGKVVCVEAACLSKWPPLTAAEFSVGDGLDKTLFSLITRPDGTKQVALNGRPLYAMSADEPGDANCQGLEGWWIRNPDGTKNTNQTATSRVTAKQ